jgi:coenzyme F420-0:L-glutamate ligase/coenzyme F420-1:gamma-L-glutamate ligase
MEDDGHMQLYAVKTRVVKVGDNLVEVVLDSLRKQRLNLENDDMLALASKVVSYSQRRIVNLSDVKPSRRAEKLAKKFSLEPGFAELVVDEADKIYGGVEKALLTLKDNVLTANAGIDNKNAPVMVVDSGLVPLRIGTVGLALAVAGFSPIREWRGRKDLYGKTIVITRHAVADDLASAAHLLMGEAAEKTPVVLIRDAPVDFDNNIHSVAEMVMPSTECIFMSTFEK